MGIIYFGLSLKIADKFFCNKKISIDGKTVESNKL